MADRGLAGQRVRIISVPLASDVVLTPAERDVARRAARGESNEAIARARGSSVRTVANQMAAILRKVGARGRSELAILLDCEERL